MEGRAVPDYGAPFNSFGPNPVRVGSFPISIALINAVGWCLSMEIPQNYLPCDGCGLPASPAHIAQRVHRLELATRFRPVHIGILFVALEPATRAEDDFYGPPKSQEFFDSFLEALEISPANNSSAESKFEADDVARLAEFQHRGYFLSHLSECPLPEPKESPESAIARLAPTLIRRIRFNYRPRHVAPMGKEMLPLVEILNAAGLGPNLILNQDQPLPVPRTGSRDWFEPFRRSVATAAPRENLSSGYDRIQVTPAESKSGAGGVS